MNERAIKKGSPISLGVSLVMGVGLVVSLQVMACGDKTDHQFTITHVANPTQLTMGPGDGYCVALEGGGPYPGCNQVFTDVQSAVDAASGGEIIKIATGVYTDVQSHPVPPGYLFPAPGGLITQVVYVDKAVTIRGGYTITNGFAGPPDATANPTTLDAQGQGRGLFIAGDIEPTVEGLHIANGNADGLGGHESGDAGGGVYVLSTTATISDNSIFGSSADNGGGLFLYNSDATVIDNKVFSNTGHLGGGLSLEESNATLSGNTISTNTAGTDGGGLHLRLSEGTLAGNVIVSNTAQDYGGGLCLEEVNNVTLRENTIAFNAASAGGGLYAYYAGDGWIEFTCSGDIFFANTAGCCGGGMHLEVDTSATLNGITVISNTVGRFGGGLVLGEDTRVTLRQSTVALNTAAGDGGGMLVVDNYDATLLDNVITGNRAGIAGGGLHAAYFSHVTLNRNIVLSNSAQHGGGLSFSEVDQGTLTNNVVADNRAGVAGGGLYVDLKGYSPHHPIELLHTTIARNGGGAGSGLFVTNSGWSKRPLSIGTVTMTNTILVSHTVGISVAGGSGVTVNGILWHNTPITVSHAPTATVIVQNQSTGDPAFAADGYHLTTGSAAIDAGVNAGVFTDVDGEPRSNNVLPDLGADEFWDWLVFVSLPLVMRNYP